MIRLLSLLCFVLLVQPVFAIDWKDELKTSPAFLVVTGRRPETTTKPTGKFKTLADTITTRIKQVTPDAQIEVFMVEEGRKRGLVIFSYSTYSEVRLENMTCDSCPNSVYHVKGNPPEWLTNSLETWMKLDHGWDTPLAKKVLKTCKVEQVRRDSVSVDYPYEEVRQYLEKVDTR